MDRKKALRELWKNIFGDSDEFIDLFFTNIYKEENAVTIEINGRIISALHIIPYQLQTAGAVLPVAYICGVATLPEERGKGFMKQMMEKTHSLIRERGFAHSVLIPAEPWLFDAYRSLGYKTAFYYDQNLFQPVKEIISGDYKLCSVAGYSLQTLFEEYQALSRREGPYIKHSQLDFDLIMRDLELSGGALFLLGDHRRNIHGMAFTYPHPETNSILCKEIVTGGNIQAQKKLLSYISEHSGCKPVWYRTPSTHRTESTPYGMIRPVDKTLFTSDTKPWISLMLD